MATKKLSPIVEALRNEAKTSAAFEATAKVFAARQRTRRQVTLYVLKRKLDVSGFSVSVDDCRNVLAFLSKMGIGALERDVRGKPRMLKEIQVSLQSVGKAALGQADEIENFEGKKIVRKPKERPQVSEVPAENNSRKYKVALIAYSQDNKEGKQMTFNTPLLVTPEELGELLISLHDRTEGASS